MNKEKVRKFLHDNRKTVENLLTACIETEKYAKELRNAIEEAEELSDALMVELIPEAVDIVEQLIDLEHEINNTIQIINEYMKGGD